MKKGLIFFFLFTAILSVPIFSFASSDEAILVRYKDSRSSEDIARDFGKGTSSVEKLDSLNAARVRDVSKAAEYTARVKNFFTQDIEFIEKDVEVRAFTSTNDPLLSQQYSISKISAPTAWDITTGSSNIKIADIDTGVNGTIADLASRVLAGYNFVSDTAIDANSDSDDNGHGTGVSSIIAANTNNSVGMAGISWTSKIIPIKVLNSLGNGTSSNLALGIRYAADNGAKIINMSLGSDSDVTVVSEAVDYAFQKGCLLIAASGNDGGAVSYPAKYGSVVAVGATDSNDQVWSGSNYGSEVDLVAPGVSVLIADEAGTFSEQTGTSLAAPQVSGVAALVWATNTFSSNVQIVQALEEGADKVAGMNGANITDRYGYGRLNGYNSFVSKGTLHATWAGQSIYPTLSQGDSSSMEIQFRNTGTATWYSSGPHPVVLALDKYWANRTAWQGAGWINENRMAVAVEGTVSPGQTGTFRFNVACPSGMIPGSHRFQVRLVAEGLTWFDNPDTNGGAWWNIIVPNPRAEWAGQSGYVSASPGQTVDMSVAFRNVSGVTWRQSGSTPTNLAIDRLQDPSFLSRFQDSSWLSNNRIASLPAETIANGEIATYNFKIKIPSDIGPGSYRFNARLVQDGFSWFEPDVNGGAWWTVDVPSPKAEWAGQSDYPVMNRDETQQIWVKFRNKTSATWKASGPSPVVLALDRYWSDRTAWQGAGWINENRMAVAEEGDIAPGQVGTYRFNVYAPSSMPSGFHKFYARLVTEGVAWFDNPDTNGASWWGITVR